MVSNYLCIFSNKIRLIRAIRDWLKFFFCYRVDLFFYAIFPFIVMLICSTIIIITIFKSTSKLKRHSQSLVSKKRIIKNLQLSYILLVTNCLFFLLVSPLVVLNALNKIQQDTVLTTSVYILAYANHA
jgi:hypothetical protein